MEDQAKRLRELMGNKIHTPKKAKTLAIASGKGGVGKTNFAINLAISLKNLGHSVLLFDADIGLSNIEILTGISAKYTIIDLILKSKSIYDIIEEGPKGIKIISGGFGYYDLSIINDENLNKLFSGIEKLEGQVDFIIFDIGAGISDMVLNFILAADEAILITTPDPTSLMDVYTLIKALTISGYSGILNIVTNIVENRTEALNIFEKLNKVSNNFLNIELKFLGYLEKDNLVSKSVRSQQPFTLMFPKADISKRMNIMALKLIDIHFVEEEIKLSFTQKLKSLIFERGR